MSIRCFLQLIAALLCFQQHSTTDASLTPTSIENVCPGDRINLTCSVNSDVLQWRLPATAGGFPQLDVTLLDTSTSLIGMRTPVPGDTVGIYTVILDRIDTNPTRLTSTLEVTLLETLAGTTIECSGSMVTIMFYDPPIPPQNLMIIESINNTDSSTVTIQWSSLQTSGGAAVDNYTVSVAPGPLSSDPSLTVMDTMIELILNYNVQYTVSVVATNCRGSSGPSSSIEFTLVQCMNITAPSNGDLGPVTSRAEGSTVTFHCNDGFIPTGEVTATCMADMTWNPDPGSVVCSPMFTSPPPVDCGVPDPPVNGSFVGSTEDTSEGSVIFYKCNDGLFPIGNLPSTCDSNGMWNSNPMDQSCTTEQFSCSLPAPPVNGFVLQTSNFTILFGCNDGYTPLRNFTTNCIAMNLWSPDPAEHQCMKVDTAGPAVTLGIGGAVGVTFALTLFPAFIAGLIIGVILTYVSMRSRNKCQSTIVREHVNQPATTDPGPVYDDVLLQPKGEIELETNLAYGPIRR